MASADSEVEVFSVVDVDDVPESARLDSQVWVLLDERDSNCCKRCYFPNEYVVERTMKVMLKENPEVRHCPNDYSFYHVADLYVSVVDSIPRLFLVRSSGKKEFGDYAN